MAWGCRDVLLNMVHTQTGHVCEVQLTLLGFMSATQSGGHAMYKVLRLVGRLEEWSSTYQGTAKDEDVAERLRDGDISVLDITGSEFDDVRSRVVPALASPRCFLTSLKLNFISGLSTLAGEVLTEAVLRQLSPTLEVLESHNCGAGGPVPPGLRLCTRLSHLHLGLNHFDGGVPDWIGDLRRLRHLDIEQCGLTGIVPDSLGRLDGLRVLDLVRGHRREPLSCHGAQIHTHNNRT